MTGLADHIHRFILARLEAAMAPDLIPRPAPAVRRVNDKGQVYWQSGYVTALTEDVCNREALASALSMANVPPSLLKIPWC